MCFLAGIKIISMTGCNVLSFLNEFVLLKLRKGMGPQQAFSVEG